VEGAFSIIQSGWQPKISAAQNSGRICDSLTFRETILFCALPEPQVLWSAQARSVSGRTFFCGETRLAVPLSPFSMSFRPSAKGGASCRPVKSGDMSPHSKALRAAEPSSRDNPLG